MTAKHFVLQRAWVESHTNGCGSVPMMGAMVGVRSCEPCRL